MMMFRPTGTLKPLRGRQIPVIPAIADAIREGHKRIVVQGATGFGKTILAAHLMSRSAAKGKRPLFVAPAIALVNQTLRSFEKQGIGDIGVIQAQHERTDWNAQIQIASRDTLVRRPLPEVDFVIIDECHLSTKRLDAILDGEAWADKVVIGLSATPWSRGMGLHWTKLIVAATINDLIKDGPPTGLSPFRVFAPKDEYEPDMTGVKEVNGEFQEEAAARIMSDARLVGDAVDHWIKHRDLGNHPGDRTFLYGVNRAHAKSLMAEFQSKGIPCGYIDGESTKEERTITLERYRNREDKVLCNVGVLVTGVDEDVRCIVDCAPVKSQIRHVQKIGRGLRLADGKGYCIARDSEILTPNGLVKIQDITLDHMVWDGINFVHHGGAVCRGVKDVIEHDGIIGTPDHEVMTDDGFQKLGEAKHRQKRIVTTGIGRHPVRYFGDNFKEDAGGREFPHEGGSPMRELRDGSFLSFLQHEEEAKHDGVSVLQSQKACSGPEMAIRSMPGTKDEMRESIGSSLFGLRRAWDKVLVPQRERRGSMDCGQYRNKEQVVPDRQDKQRRELRAWKHSMEFSDRTNEQHEGIGRNEAAEDNRLPKELPPRSLCGHNSSQNDGERNDGRRDIVPMGDAVMQTQREVWDILNAGPLQRFTANGKLVHNCLVLDHGGNHTRAGLGMVTDIHHEELDTRKPGEKDKDKPEFEPPKPRKCKKCHYLIPPKTKSCPACGDVYQAVNLIEHEKGELVEITSPPKQEKAKKPKKAPMDEKQVFYSGLLYMAQQRGFKKGFAQNKFREKFGTWPRGLSEIPTRPTKAVKEFESESRKRYLESKEAVTF